MMLIMEYACMGAVGTGEISVPFSQVCCEPKTTLKKLRLKKTPNILLIVE